jgi:hypothetical protein
MHQWYGDGLLFAKLFNARKQRIFCLVEQEDFHVLQSEGLGAYHVVKQAPGRMLISNAE